MTKDEINRAIAEACGIRLFVMLKQGAYYRPGASGYTVEISEAGQWSEDEAKRLECSKGFPDEVRAVPAPIPNYHGCLNACHEMEKTLDDVNPVDPPPNEHFTQLDVYWSKLESAVEIAGWPRFDFQATAPQRCEAFLRVKGIWREDQ